MIVDKVTGFKVPQFTHKKNEMIDSTCDIMFCWKQDGVRCNNASENIKSDTIFSYFFNITGHKLIISVYWPKNTYFVDLLHLIYIHESKWMEMKSKRREIEALKKCVCELLLFNKKRKYSTYEYMQMHQSCHFLRR